MALLGSRGRFPAASLALFARVGRSAGLEIVHSKAENQALRRDSHRAQGSFCPWRRLVRTWLANRATPARSRLTLPRAWQYAHLRLDHGRAN